MKMHDCDSSLIHSYGYDPDTMKMEINFHKGGRYSYSGVSQDQFMDFLQSSSKGSHFLKHIKGRYDFTKV